MGNPKELFTNSLGRGHGRRRRRGATSEGLTARPTMDILAAHPQRGLLREKRSTPTHQSPPPNFLDPLWEEQWQLHERYTHSLLPSHNSRVDGRDLPIR